MITPRRNDHIAKRRAAAHQVAGEHQHAEDAGLAEHAGGERARGRRSDRVGLGQPDMQREGAGLGPEAKEDQHRGQPQRVKAIGADEGGQRREGERRHAGGQQEDAHEHHQTADDGDVEVRLRRAHGLRGLLCATQG